MSSLDRSRARAIFSSGIRGLLATLLEYGAAPVDLGEVLREHADRLSPLPTARLDAEVTRLTVLAKRQREVIAAWAEACTSDRAVAELVAAVADGPSKVWLLWYTSPEQTQPDEPQLEGVFLVEATARARAETSHWYRVEERDVA